MPGAEITCGLPVGARSAAAAVCDGAERAGRALREVRNGARSSSSCPYCLLPTTGVFCTGGYARCACWYGRVCKCACWY
eukprot:696684-Rhodomonas_salina.1